MTEQDQDKQPLPSYFLENQRRLEMVSQTFSMNYQVDKFDEVKYTMADRADKMFVILKQNLVQHIKLGIEDERKHYHYFLQWFSSNLSRFCAQVTLA